MEAKAASKKTTAVNALLENGVMAWISVEIATKNIETIDESKRLAVIDAQLMFYKHVILSGRKCHHTLFTKSSKGRKLTFEELFKKLLNVIRFVSLPDEITNTYKSKLKPLEERKDLIHEQKQNLKERIFNSRLSQEIDRRNKIAIPLIKENPDHLINCNIKHKLKESRDAEEIWCCGKVLSIKKYQASDSRNTVFVVQYYDDPVNNFTFPLILDMEKKECFPLDGLNI